MNKRPEIWAWAAFLLGAVVAAGWAYLLSRPGGEGPIWFYSQGRYIAVLIALVLAVIGVIVAWRAKPFLGRSRGLAFGVLLLVVGAAPFPVPYPSSREFQPSTVLFRLPVEGPWRVVWGGDGGSGPLAHMPERRFGLVLVREEGGRRSSVPEPAAAADFLAFGQTVIAPTKGRVVSTAFGHPDRVPGQAPEGPPAGNHIVLEVAYGEYLVLAHLRQGSVKVKAGQMVEFGQELAEVGASGTGALWGEPHLAVHVQTVPEPFGGEAIPWAVAGYSVAGVSVPAGLPEGGVAMNGELEGQIVTHGVPGK